MNVQVQFLKGNHTVRKYSPMKTKMKMFAFSKANKMINKGYKVWVQVSYPDGATNTMTCETVDDVKWAIKNFYSDYLKDYKTLIK